MVDEGGKVRLEEGVGISHGRRESTWLQEQHKKHWPNRLPGKNTQFSRA